MRRLPIVFLPMLLLIFMAGCTFSDNQSEESSSDDSQGGVSGDDTESSTDDDSAAPITNSQRAVVPSPGLPHEIALENSNNNLDVVDHYGRVFLAFRTAPTHFASAKAKLYIVSSLDEERWDFEDVIELGRDLREPRLLSWNGRLFLYFAVLGTNPFDFQPSGMMVTEYNGPGDWTEPELFYGEGFIPWRTKVIGGVPYMTAYIGGENLYDFSGQPIEVHWLTTGDGLNWVPVVPGQPVVLQGGCSETDFVFQDDGSLIAVCRNEAGDSMGWGSKICRAGADSLGTWHCNADLKKYDSPLLFRQGKEIYLIGRRNLSLDGNYDLEMDNLPPEVQGLIYAAVYWFHNKRCSLWRVDPAALTASFVLDFPSKGDTCYAGLLDLGEGSYEIYNYTSPVDGPDVFWLEGQLGLTSIYRLKLSFP